MTLSIENLGHMLWLAHGAREEHGTQASTVAVGWYTRRPTEMFIAFQNNPPEINRTYIRERLLRECAQRGVQVGTLWDGRSISLRESGRPAGEMTGMHAEMLVLSAMMEMNIPWGALAGESIIVANAKPCLFCENLLTRLDITAGGLTSEGLHKCNEFGQAPPRKPLTGWWNPFNNTVYSSNNQQDWDQDIPGGGP